MVTDRARWRRPSWQGSDPFAVALYRAALLEADRILRRDELTLRELARLEATLARILEALRA